MARLSVLGAGAARRPELLPDVEGCGGVGAEVEGAGGGRDWRRQGEAGRGGGWRRGAVVGGG